MANDSGSRSEAKGKWLVGLVDAWRSCVARAGGAPELSQVADELAIRVGVAAPVALGWLQACDWLAAYAGAPLEFDADAIDEERAGNEAARRATLPVLQARLQARVDAHDESMAGAVKCPVCLKNSESRGRVARQWHSSLGLIKLSRRWSWCDTDKLGVSEAQRWLRLPDGQYTAQLCETIAMVATTVPHGMAVDLVGRMLGVQVSEHGVQDIVQQRAAPLVAMQDAQAKDLDPQHADGSERSRPRPRDAVEKAPEVAYLETDGVFPMTRQEMPDAAVPAEPGARGGKGKRYKLEGREVKNAVLYTADACTEESDRRGAILHKTYVSHLGNWHDFKRLAWVELRRLRFDQAKLLVLLSDGAEWIRELSKWLPFPVLLILDLFHAKHRIWQVANALHGDRTPEASAWAHEQCLRVEAGEVADVIEALRFLRPRAKATRELVDALRTYFENNKDRMDYPAYRARGLRVSSSAVESANYHVTGARLKLQGMRWSETGAAEMARLRADLFNGKWEKRTRELIAA